MNNIIYLTEQEIDEIEKLTGDTINDYIRNLTDEKKQLVIKQYAKERAIRQWQAIASEEY